MKFTLLVTQNCNLACSYCYVGQRPSRMSREVAAKVVEFAYRTTPPAESIEFGFFGGEPLLEFARIREIVDLIERHPGFDRARVRITVISNGTIFTPGIAEHLRDHAIALGISCDGAPEVHDRFRRFRGGRPSAAAVAANIRRAREALGRVMVNAVYRPETLRDLPTSVDYLSALGVRQIYLTPDLSAPWGPAEASELPAIFGAVGQRYVRWHLAGEPHFVSLLDAKIAVILRGGYDPLERCRMGRGEFAFTPEGRIYPCERLVGDGTNGHAIGDLETGIRIERLVAKCAHGDSAQSECRACGLRDYCMHWCGCSNYFASGFYDRVGPFQCAAEKASIRVAFEVFQLLERRGVGSFHEHLSGRPQVISLKHRGVAAGPTRAGTEGPAPA